ncbi:TPA: protein kinase [Candidatus Woesearchaeota archaeon]|nr:protein kinase [Candidatus Woesearchaeota archaeon]
MTLAQATRRPITQQALQSTVGSAVADTATSIQRTERDDLISPIETFRLGAGAVINDGRTALEIEKVLGQGGEALSYLAHDQNGVKKVVKMYRERDGNDLGEQLSKQFLRLNAALGTDTTVLKINPIDYAIVRDYTEGVNLAEFLEATKRRFSAAETIDFLVQMTEKQLGPLHKERLIHGDIKPENIIVGIKDGVRTYTMIDFGLLHEEGPAGTVTLISSKGTPGYSRPYITDHTPTRDYYALAETACLLFNGTKPEAHLSAEQDRIDDEKKVERLPVDNDFKRVLLRMYGHKKPYKSVDEIVGELKKLSRKDTTALDLASARRLEQVRSKDTPGIALTESINGLEALFKEEYAKVAFAQDKPLDTEYKDRLVDALQRLHYTEACFENVVGDGLDSVAVQRRREEIRKATADGTRVFQRTRLHEHTIETVFLHGKGKNYFSHTITKDGSLLPPPEKITDINVSEAWYNNFKSTGRLAAGALGAGVLAALVASTGFVVIPATYVVGAGIGLAANVVGGYFATHKMENYYDAFPTKLVPKNCLTKDKSYAYGLIPFAQHHLVGKLAHDTARIAKYMHKAEQRTQQLILDNMLKPLPLYTYDA